MKISNSFRVFCKYTGLVLSLTAYATDASAVVLDEIVVTAQKREQKLQDVGISVTTFTGEQLSEFGYTTPSEMVNQVPGLAFTASGGDGGVASFNLRGVGQSDFSEHQEAPVALYIDQTYVSAMAGLTFQLFDIERVEVLRGPQGTLFGRNATGGLVHFISRKPTENFEGYGEFTIGEHNQIKFEGAISGPLSENLFGRLSVAAHDRGGYVENRIGEDGGELTNFVGRGQLLYQPNDDFEILIKASAAD